MNAHDRYDRFRRLGYCDELLIYCENEAANGRRQRRQTAGNKYFSEAAERMKFAVWNVTRPKAEKDKEKQFMMNANKATLAHSTTSRLASSIRRID
jgi:hypothetical protein